MRAAVTADLHSRARAEYGTKRIDGVPAPVHDLVRALTQVKHLAVRLRLDALWILGDVMHDRRSVDSEAWVRLARALGDMELPITIIPGNHDLTETRMITALETLRSPTLRVLLEPTDEQLGDVLLRWVPYSRKLSRLEQAFNAPVPRKWQQEGAHKLLLTHAAFNGCKRGPGDYATEQSGCSLESLVEQGWWVRSGHFHLRHGPYVGSTMQLNFGDAGMVKGFEVVDFSQWGDTAFHPLDGPAYAEVSSPEEVETLLEEVDPGNLILRYLVPPNAQPGAFNWVADFAQDVRSITPKYLQGQAVTDAAKVEVAAAESDQEQLRRFLKHAAPGLPLERAVELGMRALQGGGI